ncbi:MAG: sigma-54-dependent Fis family transcriptional regulator [Planctomycetes bacterium]|nr:sigma-54-dependent Fis family transcriptional regulator [Planctomycetota bacterium]
MSKILLIEDDRNVCWALEEFIKDSGHEVVSASSAEEGLSRLTQVRPDLIFLDVRLPGMSGLDALPEIRARDCAAPVVVITAHGNMDTAIQAIQRGAFEYLTKPIDLDQVGGLMDRALAAGGVRRVPVPAGDAERALAGTDPLLGSHPLMQEVFKQIGAVSQSDLTVLIEGGSGTGKELAARAIHRHSHRAAGPFVAVDCARLPETLAESELYGHERGAFTGAAERHLGHFERAQGGTVLLDEIGDLSPPLQKKLLRFLQERAFERVGGSQPVHSDVRVLAATHRPLQSLVQSGQFREDLYFRLHVVVIRIPDLRDRPEDIDLLAFHFLGQAAPGKAFSMPALEALRRHTWPGNVRELRNAVEHAAVLSRSSTIQIEDLPESARSGATHSREEIERVVRRLVDESLRGEPSQGLHALLLPRLERPLLQRVLEFTGGNQVRAARLLGLHRTTLRKKIAEYGL